MQNLIVLGLIPGTDIQISFAAWIVLTIVGSFLAGGWLLRRARIFRNWLVTSFLLMSLHRRPHLRA